MRSCARVLLAVTVLVGCAQAPDSASEADTTVEAPARPRAPQWTFDEGMVFPADRSLLRPEDGVLLADGRLLVADQNHGLRLVADDGSHRPFGQFEAAGYEHSPPEIVGGPNGVTLEPDGRHVLVADVYRGGLYRVDTESEQTERIYQHPYGINMARADSRGGIWFSQSTENRPENGEVELFESVGVPNPDGALFYLPPAEGGSERAPRRLADGILFANGLALDEAGRVLYLSATMGSQVLRFDLDVEAGEATNQGVAADVGHPDNLELDRHGRLWIASALRSEIVVFDPVTGEQTSVLRVQTPESVAQIELIDARLEEGVTWVDLIGPALFAPAPGLITGMILDARGEQAAYATGLGDGILRLNG